MNSKEKQALKNVTRMREKGIIEESILLLNKLLKVHFSDGRVLVEEIKLLLLRQQNEHAYKCYMVLRQLPNANSFREVEYLLRLKIVMSEHQIPEIELVDIENSSKWVVCYQNNGTDPLYPVKITDWLVTCNQGPVCYNFVGQCPSCNSTYQFPVHMTLLIEREFLCPVCLARQMVNYETIKMAIEKKTAESKYTDEEKYRLDQKLHEMRKQLNSDAMDGDNFPRMCSHLNINYLYMVNQLIIGELLPPEEGL